MVDELGGCVGVSGGQYGLQRESERDSEKRAVDLARRDNLESEGGGVKLPINLILKGINWNACCN